MHASPSTLRAPRHARLFELIRQGAYARRIAHQIEAANPPPLEAMHDFRARAAVSLGSE